jgi:uncharacterized protein YndB with AHSA1/START domain
MCNYVVARLDAEEATVIRRQVVLPVDPGRMWDALTDPDQAAGWFGGRIEWELQEGAPLRFRDDDGSGREGHVEVVRPGRYLRYRWWRVEPAGADESEVTYLIEPTEAGCRLTIQERDAASPAVGGRPDSLARGSYSSWSAPASTWSSPASRGSSPASRGSAPASTWSASASWTRWDERVAGAWAGLAAPACSRASA